MHDLAAVFSSPCQCRLRALWRSGLFIIIGLILTIPLIVLWMRIRTGRARLHVEIARPPDAD